LNLVRLKGLIGREVPVLGEVMTEKWIQRIQPTENYTSYR